MSTTSACRLSRCGSITSRTNIVTPSCFSCLASVVVLPLVPVGEENAEYGAHPHRTSQEYGQCPDEYQVEHLVHLPHHHPCDRESIEHLGLTQFSDERFFL